MVITRTTRNRLAVNPVRGFESHRLRGKKNTERCFFCASKPFFRVKLPREKDPKDTTEMESSIIAYIQSFEKVK